MQGFAGRRDTRQQQAKAGGVHAREARCSCEAWTRADTRRFASGPTSRMTQLLRTRGCTCFGWSSAESSASDTRRVPGEGDVADHQPCEILGN